MPRIIYNKYIPFGRFAATTLGPIGIFIKTPWKGIHSSDENPNGFQLARKELIEEEYIHWEQQKALLFIPFYVLYLLEWVVRIFYRDKKRFKTAYDAISFEREAKENKHDTSYKDKRDKYAWIKYLK
tara:strand:+ start:79 stop:459 length:381 start_codon:yes stop_codon:yes gene_type:complete